MTDVIFIWLVTKCCLHLLRRKIWRIAFGAPKNKTLVQERKYDIQSVANGDRWHIEIGLRLQSDIRRS